MPHSISLYCRHVNLAQSVTVPVGRIYVAKVTVRRVAVHPLPHLLLCQVSSNSNMTCSQKQVVGWHMEAHMVASDNTVITLVLLCQVSVCA